jgi:hypothetical protein
MKAGWHRRLRASEHYRAGSGLVPHLPPASGPVETYWSAVREAVRDGALAVDCLHRLQKGNGHAA